MAQYTPSSGDTVRPHRSPWGAFPTREFRSRPRTPQIEAGILVTLSTAAAVGGVAQFAVIPSTGAGALATFSARRLHGGQNGHGGVSSAVGPQVVSVWEANPMVEFKATTIGAAQVSSVIGLRKALLYDSTLKIHRIDLTASTATDWRVLVTQNLGAEGDSGGYMAFRFINRLGDQINSTLLSSSPLLAFYS
jgi:hypothetical protein